MPETKIKIDVPHILVFVAAFIIVTGGLIYLNSVFNNIFTLDFTPAGSNETAASTVSKNDPSIEVKKQLEKKAEPIEKEDSVEVANAGQVNSEQKIIPEEQNISGLEKDTSFLEKPITPDLIPEENEVFITENNDAAIDTIYQQWIKDTAKLYEKMDPKKAAKIIVNYSENTARDIIYGMKKKKAAEILTELDPGIANKITKFNQGKDS